MALDFNGSDDAILVLSAGGVPITAAPLTMACWINPDDVESSQGVMALAKNSSSLDTYFELKIAQSFDKKN